MYAVPHEVSTSIDEFAAFAMDSWVISRLTVTGGLRLDRFGGQVNPMSLPAGRFVGARSFPELHPTEPFFDLSPRVSAVYDLFGNAHTALKFSANKYLTPLSVLFFNPFAPNSSTPDTRIWLDTDFIPGSSTPSGAVLATNGDNIAQDNEIGPRQNNRFGLAAEQRADSDLQREFSWDYSASVQHEIRPNLSVMAGWYYSATHDAQQTINVLRSISDYTPFQMVNPYIPSEMVTIFRLNNNKVGVVDNVTTNSSVNHRDYQCVRSQRDEPAALGRDDEFRLGDGARAAGELRYAEPEPAALLRPHRRAVSGARGRFQTFRTGTNTSSACPRRFRTSSSSARRSSASLVQTGSSARLVGRTLSARAARSRGRCRPPSSPGGITEAVTVPLLTPGISYLDRWNQLDLSVRRSFKVGQRFELRPALELYNVTNGAVVLSRNNNFGPALDAPLSVLQGRFTKLSVLVKF